MIKDGEVKKYVPKDDSAPPNQSIISVNPFRCRMWSLHDRLEEHITDESCREEIASFARHGQLVPVLARPLRNDAAYQYELIFGARRLFVARHMNLPLRLEVQELSDREAIVAMDIENRHRRDISPYERGLSYARWLREGYFSSQDEIALSLKVSASQVSRLLKVARLPPVIVSAFENPSDICELWAVELASALEDPRRREPTIRAARELGRAPARLPSREVCRRLLSAGAKGRKLAPANRDEVVLSETGTPLYRIRHDRSWVTLRLPITRVSAKSLANIRCALSTILDKESADAAKHKGNVAGKALATDRGSTLSDRAQSAFG
jgi:ParB family chromosome partitioning protein